MGKGGKSAAPLSVYYGATNLDMPRFTLQTSLPRLSMGSAVHFYLSIGERFK